MKSKLILVFENEHEVKRLIDLIIYGKQCLNMNARQQHGESGFTKHELEKWHDALKCFKESK
ncbi:MAG: hypothetical protein KAT68_19595 [Bacteroidales bacterium]|nr:hypothetical protein [Bacteroidales bacterium]